VLWGGWKGNEGDEGRSRDRGGKRKTKLLWGGFFKFLDLGTKGKQLRGAEKNLPLNWEEWGKALPRRWCHIERKSASGYICGQQGTERRGGKKTRGKGSPSYHGKEG